MICVTPRATAGSGKPAPAKSGRAIEMGLKLPRVTSSLSCAREVRGIDPANATAAPAPNSSARRRLTCGVQSLSDSIIVISSGARNISAADHVARIEVDLEVFPLVVMLRLEHVERLTTQDRAQSAL